MRTINGYLGMVNRGCLKYYFDAESCEFLAIAIFHRYRTLTTLSHMSTQEINIQPPDEICAGGTSLRIRRDQITTAISELEEQDRQLKHLHTQEIELCFQRAMDTYRSGDDRQVLVDCQRILGKIPHHLPTRYLHAMAHLRLKNYKIALFNFNQYLNHRTDHADAYKDRGTCQYYLGNFSEALADFDRAMSLQPNCPIFYHWRGLTYQQLGNLQAAMEEYDRGLQLDPRCGEIYHDRATIYLNRGDHDRALKDCDRAIRYHPQLVESYDLRAAIYRELGNFHAALADYHRILQLDTERTCAYIHRSWIYFRRGEYNLAMADCQQVLKIDSRSFCAHYLLGIIRSLLGLKHEAIFNFTKAIEINPHSSTAYYHRGGLYFDLQHINEAMNDFHRAEKIKLQGWEQVSECNETHLYGEGLALYYMNQRETAKSLLQQSAIIANKFRNSSFYQQTIFTLELLGLNSGNLHPSYLFN